MPLRNTTAPLTHVGSNAYLRDVDRTSEQVALATGGFAAVITAQGSEADLTQIFVRHYDDQGRMIARNNIVEAASRDLDPSIISTQDGGYMVLWYQGGDLAAQRFDAEGQATSDLLMLPVPSRYSFLSSDPQIVILEGGQIVANWLEREGGSFINHVYTRVFDLDGTPLSDPIRVDSFVPSQERRSTAPEIWSTELTALDGGGFVVTFKSADIYVRTFDADGIPADTETRVNLSTANNISTSDTSALADGRFVITWTDVQHRSHIDGADRDVYARIFDNQGRPLSRDLAISNGDFSDERSPSVFALSDGGFISTWHKSYAQMQRFAANGDPLGQPIRLSENDVSTSLPISVIELGTGNIIVSWRQDDIRVDYEGTVAQQFSLNALSTGIPILVGEAMSGHTLEVDISSLADADGLGEFSYQWYEEGRYLFGETGTSFQLTDDHLGARISVRISYHDGLGSTEYIASDPSDLVLDRTGALQPFPGRAGTPQNDFLTGGIYGDLLEGGDGTDTLIGGGGDDTLIGGTSEIDLRDFIDGDEGDDIIDGGFGNDDLRGGAGNDLILGGFGADTLFGNEGFDTITGSALSDMIYGGDGDDFINGGFGHDRMRGDTGADRFFHIGSTGHGSDWIQDYSASSRDVLHFGIPTATPSQFQVNTAHTATASGRRSGQDHIEEAFVIYRPTGQILWALVDGGGQTSINLRIGGDVFDLLA